MSSVFALPPLLFVTFHEMYGISYTLLGTLLLVNFCTQLIIDLIFTFFSDKFNIALTVRVMPLITTAGMLIYALVPWLRPDSAITGLIVGTVVFSVSAGLSEVLLSPLIAAVPSEHPDRDMSLLHSIYGWGVFFVVAVSSLYFKIFGRENWMYLTLFFAALNIVTSLLFFSSEIPDVNTGEGAKGNKKKGRGVVIAFCAVIIFLGSGAENIMTGWISSFMENALMIPKATGDILGMAVFALMLALTRSLYAKKGKNILAVLTAGMAGAVVCYLAAGGIQNRYAAFAACIITGIATSMLWPGTLILMEENAPGAGVAAYALMAACGDFGASVGPQVTGVIVDKISQTAYAAERAALTGVTTESVGLKTAMLFAAVLPLLGLFVCLVFKKTAGKRSAKSPLS